MFKMTKQRIDVAIFHEKKNGQVECGDSYFYLEEDNLFVCALADGLGSGSLAKESSDIVIDLIKRNINEDEETIIMKCNKELKGKRGAVLGIFKIDFTTERYTYSSIGNIGLTIIKKDGKRVRNIPKQGYLSGYYRNLKVIGGVIESGTNYLLYSDGVDDIELVNSRFSNGGAQTLIDRFKRIKNEKRKDDTTLIALRYNNER